MSGNPTSLDWLYAMTALAGLLSGVVFALGRATVGIALGWTAYCVVNAFAAYPFWAVTGAAVTGWGTAHGASGAVQTRLATQ